MTKYWVLLVLLLGSGAGCGYTTQGMLPPDVQRISIPMFKNETFRLSKTKYTFKRDVEQMVTDALIQDFLEDGQLRVVDSSQAQWMLEGSITGYETEALRYSRFDLNLLEEIRVVMTVSITLKDIELDKILWHNEEIRREEDFYVAGSILDEEESAVRQASERMAKDIMIQVLERWY